jgi:MFS family permease
MDGLSLLLVKLTLAPALVVGSSLAGRRWGPEASGLLVALPLVAGPILLIVDLDHGAHFASRAAAASLLGLVALASFAVVFARVSRRRGWLVSVAAGWLAFLVVALAFSAAALPAGVGLAIALAAYAIAPRLMPPGSRRPTSPRAQLPLWDLPARALATAVLVLGLTGAAAGFGPTLTGVLTPFPISNTVLAAFVLVLEGPAHANAFLRGFLRGAFGFVAFCFLVAVLLVPLGTAAAFALALCGALVAQLVARVIDSRPRPAALESPHAGGLTLVAAEPSAALADPSAARAPARPSS